MEIMALEIVVTQIPMILMGGAAVQPIIRYEKILYNVVASFSQSSLSQIHFSLNTLFPKTNCGLG